MKGADVEALAECVFGAAARLENGPLAQVVRQGLPRPGDVTIDLGADLALGERGVLAEVIQRLRAAFA